MGGTKRLLESLSVEMGLQGEITPEVMAVGELAWDLMRFYETTWVEACEKAIKEWKPTDRLCPRTGIDRHPAS